MEAVRSNRSHRPGSSLNKVGPSQLMYIPIETKNFGYGQALCDRTIYKRISLPTENGGNDGSTRFEHLGPHLG